MNINYKQPQFELFPGQSAAGEEATRPRFFLANLTLTIENLVVLSILCIMLAVFAYSLGVERGKFVMAAQFKDRPLQQVKPLVATAPVVSVQQVADLKPQGVVPAGAVAVKGVPVQAAQQSPVQAPVAEQKPLKADDFKYTVQVASYADEKFARRVADDLGKKGFQALVMQKGKYFVLCIGKFNEKHEAVAMTAKLKSKYKDCLVRSM